MTAFLLYGLNEAGETKHSESLRGAERGSVPAIARDRLRDWHMVEVWDGPMCIVRLHRAAEASATAEQLCALHGGSNRRLSR